MAGTMVDTKPVRRVLQFTSLEQVLADAEQMAAQPVQMLGNWTLAQVVQHIADAMHCSFDGFGFMAPWWARWFIAPFVKNSFIVKPMPAGFKLPQRAEAMLPKSDVKIADALQRLRQAIERYRTEKPTAAHPFLGKLALQEWVSLNLRHAELHLSFAVPVK